MTGLSRSLSDEITTAHTSDLNLMKCYDRLALYCWAQINFHHRFFIVSIQSRSIGLRKKINFFLSISTRRWWLKSHWRIGLSSSDQFSNNFLCILYDSTVVAIVSLNYIICKSFFFWWIVDRFNTIIETSNWTERRNRCETWSEYIRIGIQSSSN